MKTLFYILLILVINLYVLKILFTVLYYKKINKNQKNRICEEDYTIIQPILSGDPRLEADLTENLKNTQKISFIWLVDKSDKIGIATVKNILSNKKYSDRVEVFYLDDVPQEVNPKIFKLAQVIDKVKTKYTIILDDDSVIDSNRLNELSIYDNENEEYIITGIPYNYNINGFYSKLVSAFINSNSIYTYFSMAYLNELKTINGMFYIVKTEILKKYDAFNQIKYWLCDDLALATFLLKKGVKIKQSTIFCNVRNNVPNLKKYIILMKRWLLFGNIYMKNSFSIKFFFMIILPLMMPTILLLLGFYLGIDYLTVIFNFLIAKVTAFYIVRKAIYQPRVEVKHQYSFILFSTEARDLLYELASELILPLILIYTLISPPVILWRNKKIRVMDGKIHYEL